MNIFFDLDGTLVDSSLRQYKLFTQITNSKLITYEKYWELKRSGLRTHLIIKKYLKNIDYEKIEFRKNWLKNIEKRSNILEDKLFPDVELALKILKKKYSIYLVTARQKKKLTAFQLKRLLIYPFFEKIICTNGIQEKDKFIKDKGIIPTHNDFFIGDSYEDICAGKKLNIKTIAVSYGASSHVLVNSFDANYIVSSIKEILDILIY